MNSDARRLFTDTLQWGKDKTPTQQQFDPNQQYSPSPQSAQTPGYPGTPSTYFNQYSGMCDG